MGTVPKTLADCHFIMDYEDKQVLQLTYRRTNWRKRNGLVSLSRPIDSNILFHSGHIWFPTPPLHYDNHVLLSASRHRDILVFDDLLCLEFQLSLP